jgi:hypothetical protein
MHKGFAGRLSARTLANSLPVHLRRTQNQSKPFPLETFLSVLPRPPADTMSTESSEPRYSPTDFEKSDIKTEGNLMRLLSYNAYRIV